MKKLICVLTLTAFALVPSLPADEGKPVDKDKPAEKEKVTCPAAGEKKGCCPKGGEDTGKKCPGQKDPAPESK